MVLVQVKGVGVRGSENDWRRRWDGGSSWVEPESA